MGRKAGPRAPSTLPPEAFRRELGPLRMDVIGHEYLPKHMHSQRFLAVPSVRATDIAGAGSASFGASQPPTRCLSSTNWRNLEGVGFEVGRRFRPAKGIPHPGITRFDRGPCGPSGQANTLNAAAGLKAGSPGEPK